MEGSTTFDPWAYVSSLGTKALDIYAERERAKLGAPKPTVQPTQPGAPRWLVVAGLVVAAIVVAVLLFRRS
jgi:hypothetical protein